ncbi:hypothetical protein BACCAP_01674 [Pseudoflavonifractor capillosus ATCC 29799]|uniref:SLH domain-containing protein n=1 Tax=Pseudoflavonifractor capillosus ATCC 29799 TaxID=411467 RepID=A6NTZ4_9FIRM|nr:S-layer homology domain-containing protein [Pseudoflavonifractor capillosus]EDN00341.1 hypothetical protein BACCAP_01674 [Pseudoflavonifractor capillosus ATCC 29799]
MKKRIVSVLLAAALVLGLAVPAFAAQAQVTVDEAAQVLAALDIMTGDENGDLHLDQPVTRAEFTKLTVAASAYADSVGPTASISPYPDVPRTNWVAPYIQVAQEKGMVRGYLDGTFRPNNQIQLVEGVSMVLSLLGYTNEDFSGAWGSGQMAKYQALGLDRGVTAGKNDPMTRQDALWLFYNLLTAPTKTGQVYLTTLGHSLTASGEIDRVALVNSAMEGPMVAEGNWQASVPFSLTTATVYRDGKAAQLSDIQTLDVVYYSESMHTVWAWSGKATGTIQQINTTSNPTAVTVGGKTYAIETASAAYDLSDLGSFRVGDSVTLLLGRTGGVAAVRTSGGSSAAVYGVVTAIGTASYQDENGHSYTADTITLTATDGGTYSYRCDNADKTFDPGDLVQVTGGTQVSKLTSATLTGKVSADGTSIGSHALASNVEILDTYGDTQTLRVYPSRLVGVNLTNGMVRWYSTNAQGEIDRLILNDVTGDLHQYGVLTDVTEQSFGMVLMSSYVYDIAGVPGVYTSQTTIWNLEKGPCQVRMDGKEVERIYNLTGTALTAVDGKTAMAGTQAWTISDSVVVYEYRDKNYYLSDLSRVSGGGYDLTGYYDKTQDQGGRIRVVIAEAE